jgi:transposase InsO family protein
MGPHLGHPIRGRGARRARVPKSTPEDQHPIHTTTGPGTRPRATSLARRRRTRRRPDHDRLAFGARRPHPARDLHHPAHHHRRGPGHPEPAKRPRSSYLRFAADQPNETWQSDFTHWALVDGTDVEILNWLDDHSRLLLSCTVHTHVTGGDVVDTFTRNTNEYGLPASTLTDNGRVYTAKFGGGRNAFEYLIAALGIAQKNGHPYHPQTQGKIERFHQTLKRWLAARPAATSLTELQAQLDQFRAIYNEQRPHRALARQTPGQAYNATIKATPTGQPLSAHYRVRHDIIDRFGKLTLRHASQLHHLGVGHDHARKPVLILTDETSVTITDNTTGEILGSYLIEPDRNYWRNQTKEPGRWPGSF